MKTDMVQTDRTGRVVLPKSLRKQFNLVAGDKLRLSVEGHSIKFEPANAVGNLVRKGSVLVCSGEFAEPITTSRMEKMLTQEREERCHDRARKRRKK